MRADQIALQLYTVRERTKQDFVGTLQALAATGYTAVEFAGYGDLPVGQLRKTLDDVGMRAMGAHVPYDRFTSDFDEAIDELHTLGADFAIVPSVREEHRSDADAVRRLAATFNDWGERCKAADLRFGYHNHGFEFAPLSGADGKTMYDLLTAETDPALVALELDLYWAAHAGADALSLLKREASRVPILHMKDLGPEPDKADLPVGAGTIHWGPILDAAEQHVEWYVVEQDHPHDAMVDVTTSLRELEGMVR